MTTENTQDKPATEGCAAAAGHVVRVYVRGHYSGEYTHATEAEAQADADDRTRRFGVLGCHYRVYPHTAEVSHGGTPVAPMTVSHSESNDPRTK